MTIYRLLPVKLLNGFLVSAEEPILSLTSQEFLSLVAPTGHPVYRTHLISAQVKMGSYVGLTIRKDFFAEGLRSAPVETMITAAVQIARAAKMHKEEAAHPLVSFILTRHDLGSDINWVLREDPSLAERMVAAWRVAEIIRSPGTGVMEADPN